jgi:four helix bundle protein
MSKSYKDLEVWKNSIDFVTKIYKITKQFPSDEKFGLISQLRRAAVSIPANIAEGTGRKSSNDTLHFLVMARGSMNEIVTELIVASNLNYIQKEDFNDLNRELDQCGKQLNGLITYFKSLADKK